MSSLQPDLDREPRPAVLFADDEAGLRALALEVLAEAGFEAIGAADGREALEHLKARPDIRVLISDVRMPEMNGTVLAAMAQARNPALKVALITAYADEAIQLLDLDKWRIVLKPFDIELVSQIAKELCEAGRRDN